MATAYKDLCIDAVDAHRLGAFWARALGLDLRLEPDDGPAADLSGPTSQHRVWMNPVPEPKTVKPRMHLDVHASSIDEHVAWGATVLDAGSFRWTVTVAARGASCAPAPRGVVLRAWRRRTDRSGPTPRA